jgi:hypothetical protein
MRRGAAAGPPVALGRALAARGGTRFADGGALAADSGALGASRGALGPRRLGALRDVLIVQGGLIRAGRGKLGVVSVARGEQIGVVDPGVDLALAARAIAGARA